MVDAAGRLLGIDTNRLGDGFYLALPADAELRQRLDASAGARPPYGPGSGSASPPPGWPGSCAVPSACPSGTACWSGWSRTAARRDRAGLRTGDLGIEAGAGRSPTPTSCTIVLDQVGEDQTPHPPRGPRHRRAHRDGGLRRHRRPAGGLRSSGARAGGGQAGRCQRPLPAAVRASRRGRSWSARAWRAARSPQAPWTLRRRGRAWPRPGTGP